MPTKWAIFAQRCWRPLNQLRDNVAPSATNQEARDQIGRDEQAATALDLSPRALFVLAEGGEAARVARDDDWLSVIAAAKGRAPDDRDDGRKRR